MPQNQEGRDWIPIKQTDFSGGVNIIDDPADLTEKELADAVNVRLTTKNTVEERLGFTEYNTNAIGANTEIRSLFQFREFSTVIGNTTTLIPIAQCSDDYIYKGSASFPGTAASFSKIYTAVPAETANSDPAFMDAMWGTLLYCNGVDVPQVWEGTYGRCQGFRVTNDVGVTYKDYTTRVSDEDATTFASIGALDTFANGDWILIKSRVPKLTGIKVVLNANVNTTASTLTVQYRSAVGTWTDVPATFTDGTKTGGNTTFGQSGDITWGECTIVPDLIDNSYGYFLLLKVSVALSATVQIKAVYLYYNIQALPSFWDGTFIKPDGFFTTVDTDVTYKDYTLNVTDDAASTVASLGGMTVTTGAFYIKSVKKFRAAFITMDLTNINTNAVTLTAKYWDGAAWQSLTIIDGTVDSGGTKTMSVSGLVSWTWTSPTMMETRRVGQDTQPFYVVKFLVNGALSATVDISGVDIIEYQDALRPMKGVIFHKNRAFMWGRADAPNYLFFSKQFLPDVWTGSDAGYIGIPSGKPITACERFYNDLMVATDDEIYILQGYTPLTFGLLKINTGGIGVSAPHSVVAVGKMIYFLHATGFYRFDGIGVIYLSKNIRPYFDDTEATYYIPSIRYIDVQGRFNRVWSRVEWTVTKGTTPGTANNQVLGFEIDHEGWWFDSIVASAFLKTESSTYQDLLYHGDYVGKVYRDDNGTSDNGTAISAYVTTRAQMGPGVVGWTMLTRGIRTKLDVQSAGSLTVQYALSGSTSFTSYGTMDMTGSGKTFVMRDIYDPLLGTAIQWKLLQSTKDYTFGLSEIETFVTPIRDVGVDI
jgi:hypothetical protein